MWFQFKSYLNFLLNATNKHGIHSPFLYDLATKCFNKKTTKEKIILFKQYKQQLLNNKKIIKVTDFGAGSKIFKSNQREIAKITKVAGISNKKAKLLIRFITYFKPNTILEIGTSLGLGTKALSLGNPKASIISLEGCLETANIAQKKLQSLKNIHIKVGDFKKTLPIVTKNQLFDIIYFDGNHQKTPTLNYFKTCLTSIHNNSIFIFDDIHWSKEMEEAWKIIKKHPKVTVTIDIFHWGIVFFRKEQAKEHFTIKI